MQRCPYSTITYRRGVKRAFVHFEDARNANASANANANANANDWIVVATAKAPSGSFTSGLGPAPIGMLVIALVTIALGGFTLRAGRRELEAQATTDGLTGLGNRRKLFADLERRARTASAEAPIVLTMVDLNGSKINQR
jgi:predicted signal transduction protein with EAL and GGDEF domain